MRRIGLRLWVPLALCLLLAGAWAAPPLWAQFNTNTIIEIDAASGSAPSLAARGLDANIGMRLVPKGTGTITVAGPLTVTGLFTAAGGQSFGEVTQQLFLAANDHCVADNTATAMVRVRVAQSDWALARTAAGAETQNITCAFTLPTELTANKGIRVDSFAIAHQITVVALTSATFQALATVTYVTNVANAINATYGGAVTITLPTATQANPYLTPATLALPAYMQTANTQIALDWQVVMANTGVYRLYGVVVNYTQALY